MVFVIVREKLISVRHLIFQQSITHPNLTYLPSVSTPMINRSIWLCLTLFQRVLRIVTVKGTLREALKE